MFMLTDTKAEKMNPVKNLAAELTHAQTKIVEISMAD